MAVHRTGLLAVLLFSASLLFAGVHETGFRGTDELRYSKIASELEPGRDLFLLHFNGHRYTDKPPLYFWLVRGSFELFGGVSPWAGRLPGVISALVSAVLCYFLAFRLFGDRRIATFSALTLMIMPRFIWIARWIRLDLVMTVFAYAAMLCFVENYFGKSGRKVTGPLFWLLLAFSFAIKGPAGPLVILGGIIAFLLIQKERARIREVFSPLGVALFAVLTAAWVLPILLFGESAASQDLIIEQNVGRILSPDRHVERPWYYLENIWHDAFPASILMLSAGLLALLRQGWRRQEEGENSGGRNLAARRLLLCWAGFAFLMFTLYPPKRPQYLLPGYPAAAIFATQFLVILGDRLGSADGSGATRLRRAFTFPLGLGFVAVSLLAFVLLWSQPLFPHVHGIVERVSLEAAFNLQEKYEEFEYSDYEIGGLLRAFGTLAIVCGSAFFISRIRRDRVLDAYACMIGVMWSVLFLFFLRVVPASNGDKEILAYAQEFSRRIQETPNLRICVFGEDKPYYNIYGDFHVEYFDKDYEDAFLDFATRQWESGDPFIVIVEERKEIDIRSAPWYDLMQRETGSVKGDPIVILKSPGID